MKIRSFDALKISKYTGCAKEGSTKVFLKSVLKSFRDESRTDATSKKERFVLIINGHLYIIFTYLYIDSIYVNVELSSSNVDKRNTHMSKRIKSCLKIMMFYQSSEFNPFWNNPEPEFQTDGA